MAVSFNKVIVAGNLTRDPQVRFLANEQAVANFGLAINRRYKSGGETKEEVTFLDVTAWGKTAELVGQYLTKGRSCLVEGHLKLEEWEDKTDGKKRSKLVVVADSVQFLDSGKKDAADAPAPSPKPRVPAPAGGGDDDGPPFARPLIADFTG